MDVGKACGIDRSFERNFDEDEVMSVVNELDNDVY